KGKLTEFAAGILGVPPESLRIQGSGEVTDGKSARISFGDIYADALRSEKKIDSYYYYNPPETHKLRDSADHEPGVDIGQYDIHYAYCFATQAAIVEVDESTGEVTVLKIIAAQDAGRSIHHQSVEGQIEGAVLMGVGYALYEEFRQKDGFIVTDNLSKLKVPSILKAPDIQPIVIEREQSTGPFGAKGMGEVPVNPAAPAIINAIYDAVGVRITELPATREKILEALKIHRRG
ncbi:MAG: molybdopterin-dependent oxidoreductase, partial [Oligoflexales bacterium]|nr:molybdopterin-dependent oxidoreductase [Oligoflexales bacterium]